MDEVLDLSIGSSIVLDLARLQEDNLYNLFNFHAKLEGNEAMNSVIGLVKSFASEQLGEFAALLDDFHGIEIFCPGDGVLYLIPYNGDGTYYEVFTLKLVDVLDLLLKKINVYNLINSSNNDLVTFVKNESGKAGTYSVDVILNEDTVSSIKDGIENIMAQDPTGILQNILMYDSFKAFNARIDVVDDKIDCLEISFDYFKSGDEIETESQTLFRLKLNAGALNYDLSELVKAQQLKEIRDSVVDIRSKIDFYSSRFYLSQAYAEESAAVIEEYNALTDEQKAFVGNGSRIATIESNIKKIDDITRFLPVYYKIDFENPTNEDIYEILTKFEEVRRYGTDLAQAIGEENYYQLSDITQKIDYSNINGALSKMTSTDETTWNLTAEELNDFNIVIMIGEINASVQFNLFFKIMMVNPALDYDSFVAKIHALNDI